MKYYLIAGERSGDLHGANLIQGIRKEDSVAILRGWGGDQMKAAGMELVTHYRDLAFMGFLEVAKNFLTIRRYLRECREDLLRFQPDALILIDYAGFNLRMAAFAKSRGIPVVYYISPKVWAWNQKRAFKIKAIVDRMFVIFPFEVGFYRKFDYEVEYVGNPLMDAISGFIPDPAFRQRHGLPSQKIIALLPGSRRQEIFNMLATMVSVSPYFPDYRFVVAGIKDMDVSFYSNLPENVSVVYEDTYNLLHVAEAALVTSGTATLETALMRVPEVVCYKTSGISYLIAKMLIKVPFISLVNLICNREVVKELIQEHFTGDRLKGELSAILEGGPGRQRMLHDFGELAEKVGEPGASARTGRKIVAWLASGAHQAR